MLVWIAAVAIDQKKIRNTACLGYDGAALSLNSQDFCRAVPASAQQPLSRSRTNPLQMAACHPLQTLRVGNREPRPDRQRRQLVNRIPSGAPVGELLFVEALGHPRVPFAGVGPDDHARVEPTTVDP